MDGYLGTVQRFYAGVKKCFKVKNAIKNILILFLIDFICLFLSLYKMQTEKKSKSNQYSISIFIYATLYVVHVLKILFQLTIFLSLYSNNR